MSCCRGASRLLADDDVYLVHSEEAIEVPLYGLTMLGYLAREGEAYRLGNWLFERWMRRRL